MVIDESVILKAIDNTVLNCADDSMQDVVAYAMLDMMVRAGIECENTKRFLRTIIIQGDHGIAIHGDLRG